MRLPTTRKEAAAMKQRAIHFVGLDVHQSTVVASVRDESGNVVMVSEQLRLGALRSVYHRLDGGDPEGVGAALHEPGRGLDAGDAASEGHLPMRFPSLDASSALRALCRLHRQLLSVEDLSFLPKARAARVVETASAW